MIISNDNVLIQTASDLVTKLINKKLTISIAESCTGGLISAILTSIPGVSKTFKGGIIAYDNMVKISLLKVNEAILKKFGAVSEETAMEMARGVKNLFSTDISIGVTGIAGPDGGDKSKPVGLVCFGFIFNNVSVISQIFHGNRNSIRESSTLYVLERILGMISNYNILSKDDDFIN